MRNILTAYLYSLHEKRKCCYHSKRERRAWVIAKSENWF